MKRLIIGAVTTLIIGALAFGIWHYRSKVKGLELINNKTKEVLMEKNLELGRAKTVLGDARKTIKTLDNKIRKEIRNRGISLLLFPYF